MKEFNSYALNRNSKKRKVAIILGFYDGYEFIRKQLQSIFDQTHQNFIIFVTDDNSKDKFSLEKLDLDEKNKKKIRVGFRNKNIPPINNVLGKKKTPVKKEIPPNLFNEYLFIFEKF